MSNELNKSIRSELQALAVSLAAAAMAELSGLAQSGARPLDVARDELREAAMLVLKRAGDSLTEHERVAQTLLTSVYSLLSPPRARQPLPIDAANKLIDRGDLGGARLLARSLFEELAKTDQDDWNYGNLVHDANIIAGLVCLAEGQANAAANALVAAGMTKGSPQLNSFGPDLSLAWKLMHAEGDAVLTYLRSVSRFWSPP